ncbi:RluA family pseudouridine synthase [Phenylobacterium sp. J367]|uniref:RluA family pseudouridine synthase n=1 Tax=Phenylobacterium sp. J367 TaxID=2898435 RepID=UPI0035B3EAD1
MKAQKRQPKPVQLSRDEVDLVRSLVIYEDPHILALNKPAGLSSQGGRGQVNTLDEMLWAFAKPGKARPRLIHRLDRDTSGVILTAKTQPAASFLGKAMMARKFAKTYRAIVTPGAPAPAEGWVEAPLRREEIGREAYMRVCKPDHKDAEAARTRYRTLAEGREPPCWRSIPRPDACTRSACIWPISAARSPAMCAMAEVWSSPASRFRG